MYKRNLRFAEAVKTAAFLILVAGTVFLLLACESTPVEEPKKDYPAFIESRPRSILVMPPVNQSIDVTAPLTFLSTAFLPLAESGYYVIPVALSDQTFKLNGVTVAEDAHVISHDRLREIFGADAALYITITRFGTRYVVVDSVTEVAASARLIDLRTSQTLWSGETSLRDTTSQNRMIGGFGSLAVSLLSAVLESAIDQIIDTASNKAHGMGRKANFRMLSADYMDGMLFGPYHPMFQMD